MLLVTKVWIWRLSAPSVAKLLECPLLKPKCIYSIEDIISSHIPHEKCLIVRIDMVYALRQKSAAKDRTSYLFPVPTTDLQIPLSNKYLPKQQRELLPLKASSSTLSLTVC